MKSFTIVYRKYFVSSEGFEVEDIEAESMEDAKQHARATAFKKSRSYVHCDYIVLNIPRRIVEVQRVSIWQSIRELLSLRKLKWKSKGELHRQ